jgi:hypothetical protein
MREETNKMRGKGNQMVAHELNLSQETIRQILRENQQKRRICAKFVSHRLTGEQKQRGLTSWQYFIQTCQDNTNFLIAFFLS